MTSQKQPKIFACVFLLSLMFGLLLAPLAEANDKKSGGGNKSNQSAQDAPEDTRILITAIDVPNQQITITYERDKTQKIYHFNSGTQITASGNPATIADVKVGQQVYSYIEQDSENLSAFDVGTAQAPPAAPAKQKKNQQQ